MPMLDDQLLDSLLHEAGNSFVVPPSGTADILGRIYGDDDASALAGTDSDAPARVAASDVALPIRVSRTTRAAVRSHRVLAVAASLVVVALVAGGALLFGSSAPKPATNAAGKTVRPPARPTASAPTTTTVPGSTGSTGSTGFAAEPSKSTHSTGTTGATALPSASGGSALSSAPSSPPSVSTNQPASSPLPAAVGQPARIEQTGSLDVQVARGALSSTVTRLTNLATTDGGFVANSQSSSGAGGDQGPSGTVTLQIPVANFSLALKEVESFGKVSQLTTKATDVTAQYVDLQAQITALEASRQQYLTIMTKASSIGDVLSVQAQLDTLQTQIQQLQGQLNVLGSETDYSTLTVQLSEPGSPPPHHRRIVAPSGLSKAWHDSLHGFASGVDGLVRVAGPALFALLCLAALALGGQLFWRRLQRHNL